MTSARPSPPPSPDGAAPPSPAPVSAQERALLPDALRGFALVGIALINVQDFAGFAVWEQTGLSRAAQVLTDVFFNGKSVALFAMLFGWGAAGIYRRHGLGVYVRRHALLLLIGTLHFLLLWHGDIIAGYAVSGLLFLLLLRVRSAGALLAWAWALFGLNALAYLASGLGGSAQMGTRQLFDPLSPTATYLDALTHRWDDLPYMSLSHLFLASFALPLFAFGGWAARVGLLERPAEHRPLLLRLAALGLSLGTLLGLGLAYLNTLDTGRAEGLSEAMRVISGLPMAFGYVGAFGLLSLRPQPPAALVVLARSGRLALTHYLTQSLVLTLVFYPYTFGLYGRVNAAGAVLVALALALLQIALSGPYLARYGRGPLETLLRWGVYGRRRTAR